MMNPKNPPWIKSKNGCKKRLKTLGKGQPPTSNRAFDGRGGSVTATEVATSFPGRCFGAIKDREKILKSLQRKELVQISEDVKRSKAR